MRNEMQFTRPTMVSPAPGFTNRVMARIAERERIAARRRVLIGSILLVAAAAVLLTIAILVLVSWFIAVANQPEMIAAFFSAMSPVTFWIGTILDMVWIAVITIWRGVSEVQMLAFSILVLGLTMFWLAVVTGSFRLSASQTFVGGS